MTDHAALKAALADKLLSVTEDQAIQTGLALPDNADGRATVLAVNAIRCVIGQAIARHPPGPDRDAFKIGLATGLGAPLGQLLSGQPDRLIAAALEGCVQIVGAAIGGSTAVNVEISSPPASHLKVVK